MPRHCPSTKSPLRSSWRSPNALPRVPLLMVVDSGGKSLQPWWDIQRMPYEQQKEWFYKAVPLGSGLAGLRRYLPVSWRMPHGTREITGVRQSVIYWGL